MTCATRGNVHRSVPNPCVRAPCRRAQSTWRSCSAFSLGIRPARPAPFSAALPPLLHCRYHRVTLCRLTSSARAIPASAPRPFAFANSRAACARRCFSPSKSRLCLIPAVPMQGYIAQLIDLSTYYARFSKKPAGEVMRTMTRSPAQLRGALSGSWDSSKPSILFVESHPAPQPRCSGGT